jgi:HEAT repeat protein
VPILLRTLTTADDPLAQSAAAALADLAGQNLGADTVRWQEWWDQHKNLTEEEWLLERLAFQTSHSRRLEGELERAKSNLLRLEQQLYNRLPPGDRLAHIESLAEADDAALRMQAVAWALEQLPAADQVGQKALSDALLRFGRDGNEDVRRAAILALGRLRDPRAFDRLRETLVSERPAIRAASARALVLQVRGSDPAAAQRQKEIVPSLQKALDDPSLEVVVEAAEGLGALGVPEAGPVLTVLLRHPSQPVRQAAALALERVADVTLVDGLLETLDDSSATVRFSVVGALGHAAADPRGLDEPKRVRLTARLEALLLRDADPGVRGRAASVLGECGTATNLPVLWQRVTATEDSRVQERSWAAIVEIVSRAANPELVRDWDRLLTDSKQTARRTQLLSEVFERWQKKDDTRKRTAAIVDLLAQAYLDQEKFALAYPLLRDSLTSSLSDSVIEKRLSLVLTCAELSLKDGDKAQTLRIIQEVHPFLTRKPLIAMEFEKLEKKAKKGP